ncbi:MAG: aminotransferase class IV [Bdellovibrionales bacterium]
MTWDSLEQAWGKLQNRAIDSWPNYYGFYSSWLDGYYKEPWAMQVPMDDHGFHRGDGVFEAVRIHQKAYFDLDAHLRRLLTSASKIGLEARWEEKEIKKICVNLASLCNAPEGILRLYLTRGPGSFSPNPMDSVGTQLYAAITKVKIPTAQSYVNGCSAMISEIPAKPGFYAQIKSLNYLQNVLMSRECKMRGFDFSVCVDESGRLAEGATENIMIITPELDLIVPRFDYTLRGTTVTQVMKLAEQLRRELEIRDVRMGDLKLQDLKAAREAAFVGTTLGVLPISSLEGHAIGRGSGAPICLRLHAELQARMATDPALRTPF